MLSNPEKYLDHDEDMETRAWKMQAILPGAQIPMIMTGSFDATEEMFEANMQLVLLQIIDVLDL